MGAAAHTERMVGSALAARAGGIGHDIIVRLRVWTAWSERLCGCERCSLSSTMAEDVCITMPPPIFRGAVPGDVMHLLDPHVTIGELRHLNANNDVLQLIAQFVRSVE